MSRGWGQGSGNEGGDDGGDPPRLIDAPGGDARTPHGWAQAWAIDLLRRTPPHRPPQGRKQRVRVGLSQADRRRRRFVLRPAIAFAVLVGCGAVASAALGRWPALVSDAYHRLLGPAASAPSVRTSEGRAARAPVARALASDLAAPALAVGSPSDELAAAAAPPAAGTPATGALGEPAATGLPASGPARGVTVRPARGTRRAPSSSAAILAARAARARDTRTVDARARHAAAAMTDDTGPVVEAMRALRVERNPGRARELLALYLDEYPDGTLAEEALAMSIEAANARRDGDADSLARKYLRLYPAGHFSKLARQTLDDDAGAEAGPGN